MSRMISSSGGGNFRYPTSPTSGTYTWKPLRVGAGGFIRGMDLALVDNTMVGRTDTYGAYVWNSFAIGVGPAFGNGMWEQLCSPDRFPLSDIASTTPGAQESFFANGGVHEIRIAPSNASIFYMGYVGNLYKTTNRGLSWVKCAGWTTLTANEMPTNNGFAQSGPKAAIDPINPNRVFYGVGFGSAGNVLKTLDGGATFATISAGQIAQAATGGTVYNIAFDPRASTQSGGNSNVIYCFSDGSGLYKSTDAGATWVLQNSAGMPTSCLQMEVNSANGDVWIVSNNGTTQSLYKYSGSTWTHVTAATSFGVPWATIAFDPNNSSNILLCQQGASVLVVSGSTDGGATWNNNSNGAMVATDVPWLALDHVLNPGRVVCDNNHTYYASDGEGVWFLSQPPASAAFNITSRSAGIEQLITNALISPPGGNPVVFSWDRAAFVIVNPKAYPSTYYPGSSLAGSTSAEINPGWDGDWASADPSFICCFADAVNGCFYSLNKGLTWSDFAHSPPPRIGGMIAASTNLNMVAGTSNNGTLYYTLDRGATAWVSLESYFNTNFGVPLISSGHTGWGNSYVDNRHNLAADRVLANTFYAFNDGSGGAGGGVYRSTDGGQTWTLRSTPTFLGNYSWLKSVPNIGQTSTSGHLFFGTGIGAAPHPAAQPLYRSTDGGLNWSDVNSLLRDVFAFGFGKNDKGSYPAIGAYGYYNGVGGFWVSKDNGVSFVKFGELTLYGTSDIVDALTGDSNTTDVWYVGLHDSGSAYYGP